MIIGIDIDDTITDTYEVLFNYAQEYTVDILKKEPIIQDVSNCNTHFYTKSIYQWTDEEEVVFWKLYYEKFIQNVRPKTLSLKYLQKLKEENNKIVLITARWQPKEFELNVEKETKEWIEKNHIPYDKLVINAINKEKVAKQENIDVFIDDSFKNCQAISNIGIKTYIMDSRTNKDLNRGDIERVYSWPHVYMKLKNK